MFLLDKETLLNMGAEITTREIKQQPELWAEALQNYIANIEKITDFLNHIKTDGTGKIRVIFTGAGTSQYVGDTIVPYLRAHGDTAKYSFESIGTTDIVASPLHYLHPEETTILVSFARSGNSPESVATVDIANQVVKNLYHITITCAPTGALAKQAENDNRNLLLLMPERSNDAGFAMTGSYSCMALTGLLVFDINSIDDKRQYVETMIALGEEILSKEDSINELLQTDVERIVYLGSGSLYGLSREAQLKVLELTAGKIATAFDSSMGFRHGPKSFINDKTLIFVFVNNDKYTQQYDLDILKEMHADGIAANVVAIMQDQAHDYTGTTFTMTSGNKELPDGYLAIADVVFAQTVSLLASIKVGNTPDTPSPSGTVNRVVKGVTIHEYK